MQKGNLPNWNAIANQTKNKEGERKKNNGRTSDKELIHRTIVKLLEHQINNNIKKIAANS